MILNLPKNTNVFYLPWIADITVVKKTKKKYNINKESINFSEFELVLGRNSLFALDLKQI